MTNTLRVAVALVVGVLAAREAGAATPPVPTIAGPISGPGRMYPDPAVSVTPNAVKVEDFPYVTGGIRNVWVDVPIATYGVFGKGKTAQQDRLCQLAGTKVPLANAVLRTLYKGSGDYTARVEQRLKQLITEGLFLPEYADMVRADARAVRVP
jgi:hypothetical protein